MIPENTPTSKQGKSILYFIPIIILISFGVTIVYLLNTLNASNGKLAKLTGDYQTLGVGYEVRGTEIADIKLSHQTKIAGIQATQTISNEKLSGTVTVQAEAISVVKTKLDIYEPYTVQVNGRIYDPRKKGYISEECLGIDPKDFYLTVKFTNPSYAGNYGWDYGFLFRTGSEPNEQYRLTLRSDRRWTLTDGIKSDLKTGPVSNFKRLKNEENLVELYVHDEQFMFSINGTINYSMQLPRIYQSGDVCLATGMYEGDNIRKGYTAYRDLLVIPLP